jgi:hypothetical protein
MKFGYYIVYGNPKDFGGLENRKAAEKKYAELLKKNGMELILAGNSFGTPEDYVYVIKGDMDSYQAQYGNQELADANLVTDQRSNFVLVP